MPPFKHEKDVVSVTLIIGICHMFMECSINFSLTNFSVVNRRSQKFIQIPLCNSAIAIANISYYIVLNTK